MDVVADHRERGSRVPQLLAQDPEVSLRVAELVVGDYLIDGRALVERKTMVDFAASIVSARVFRQASGLWRAAQPGVLILEGDPARSWSRVGRKQLQGALVSLALVFQLHILRSRDAEETVWLMKAIGRQAALRVARGLSSRCWNPRDVDARRLHLLATLPGIGPGRAERLLDRFGTLAAVLAATPEQLAAVPGVGKHTATAIRAFLDRERVGGQGDATWNAPARGRS